MTGAWRIADKIAVNAQLVDILSQLFAPELAAECEADATGRELEQLGRIDVQIESSQLRRVDVFRMNGGEVGRSRVGRNRRPERISEGIEGTVSPSSTPPGRKIGSFWFRIRLKREVETRVLVEVAFTWL